jgi:hypothetical protein
MIYENHLEAVDSMIALYERMVLIAGAVGVEIREVRMEARTKEDGAVIGIRREN